jgi:hypothetical protein
MEPQRGATSYDLGGVEVRATPHRVRARARPRAR